MMIEDENDELTGFLLTKSRKCHDITWNYFVLQGEIPENDSYKWCLHHIDPTMKYFDLSRYASWNIEDVMPMTVSQHIKLHKDFEKRNQYNGFLDKLMIEAMNCHCKVNRHH